MLFRDFRSLAPVIAVPLAVLANAVPVMAADSVTLTLKDNRFVPSEITVPSGERLRIDVKNQDATPAEFESSDLRVEKFVAPGGQISVMVGPLKPGQYKFVDEYHPTTAVGTLTAVKKAGAE